MSLQEALEGLKRGELRREAQPLTNSGRVDPPPVLEVLDLFGGEVDVARTTHNVACYRGQRTRQRHVDASRHRNGLRQHQNTLATHVVGARRTPPGGSLHSRKRVVFVSELHPSVKAQNRGNKRKREVPRHRSIDTKTHDVREPQDAHGDIWASAREPTHVSLDLDGVFGKTRTRESNSFHLFGELRWVFG